jgi:hypothetical protein
MSQEDSDFSEEEKKEMRMMDEERLLRIHKEEFKSFWERMANLSRSRIDFMKGIKYGLILGIFGNFEVQFSFSLLEGLLLGRYDIVFYASTVVVLVSAMPIVFVLNRFRKEQKEEEKQLRLAIEQTIREKYEIDKREIVLRAKEKGLIKENGKEN